ncbi:MAG: hypothetical protein IPL15_24880 [Comamonadaceae bacterium]|uniref:DUF5681 domain-containing protein n=1 Tax=Candidatus Skiveiella danica TaxID=3386177 RepID=UPI00390B4659|nr:hypothetical protein [Comamonadaceae bacterium]
MTTRKPPAAAWKPGQSGNPKGRPTGTGEVAKIRAAIAKRVPDLLDAMMTKALDGDVGAARLLLERAVPPLKAMEPTLALTLPDGTLTDQGRAVLRSVADGVLAPSQGAALLGAIGTLARVTEIDELETRIAALEVRNGKS